MSFAELDLDFLEQGSHRQRENSAPLAPAGYNFNRAGRAFLDIEMLRDQYVSAPPESPPQQPSGLPPQHVTVVEISPSPAIFPFEKSDTETTSSRPRVAATAPPETIDSDGDTRRGVDSQKVESPIPPRRDSQRRHNFFTSLQGNLFVGLDLGARFLKYVALRKTAAGYQVQDYDSMELPLLPPEMSEQEKEKIIGQQLRNFLIGKPLRNSWITSAVSGLDVLFRHHLLPRMPKKDLAGAVPWATRKDLPFPVESALIDYAVLGTRKDGNAEKMEVVAVATPAAVVERHLAQLKSNQVTPQKVSTVAIALWNLLLQNHATHTQSLLIIDIGAVSTHIAFVDHGRLQFVREITTAGNDFTEALTSTVYAEGREIALSASAAEQLKRQYGLPMADALGTTASGIPLAEIAVMMRPAVERLVNEIQRSVDYYREKYKTGALQHIYLTGGGARLKNLEQVLTAKLGVTTEPYDPFATLIPKKWRYDERLAELAPQLGVAFGLALDRRKELNLLPPALRGAFRLRAAQKYFRYFVVLGLLGIAFATGFLYFKSRQFGADVQRLQLDYQRLLPRRELYVELSHELEGLQNQLAAYQSKIVIRLTAPEHLRALSNLIPPSMALTSVNLETVTAKSDGEGQNPQFLDVLMINGVVLKSTGGVATNATQEGVKLADFLIALEKTGYFRSLDLRHWELQPDGTISFTLACLF